MNLDPRCPNLERTANVKRLVRAGTKRGILDENAISNSGHRRLPVEPAAHTIAPCEWAATIGLECQFAKQPTERVKQAIDEAVEHHRAIACFLGRTCGRGDEIRCRTASV